jgi:UDPglucose 6-dehydrogenase
MNVSIIGSGYVGLVTGACLAERGHRVWCVDSDATKIATITRGAAPFHEPGLDALLKRHAGQNLLATTDLAAAVLDSELTMLAVGTPFDGRTIDLGPIRQAAREVGAALTRKPGYHIVVVKSTVVPGTTDGVVRAILEEASGRQAGPGFGLGMNPEFLSEGRAVEDSMTPDRIVLGGLDERTIDVLAGLYASFDAPTLRTNNATAEFIKYASNSLLATLISFSNEIANLCASTPGVDAVEVMRALHLMRELSCAGTPVGMTSFLLPGCGFGGSCLPKDVAALSAWGGQRRLPTPLLAAVMEINRAQPARVVEQLEAVLGPLRSQRVTVLGLAFKPDTDDVRESPAFPIIDHLLARGATVRAFDPVANAAARGVLGGKNVTLSDTLAGALEGADAVMIVTRWEHFRALPDLLRAAKPPPLIFDARRMLQPTPGLRYAGVGRAPEAPPVGSDSR